jgi:hypothetical protein
MVWLGPGDKNSDMIMDVFAWLDEWPGFRTMVKFKQLDVNGEARLPAYGEPAYLTLDSGIPKPETPDFKAQSLQAMYSLDRERLVNLGEVVVAISRLENGVLYLPVVADHIVRRSCQHAAAIPPDHPFWEGFIALMSHPWFSRAWTYQEVLLARKALVLCGSRVVGWDAVNFSRFALFNTPALSICCKDILDLQDLHLDASWLRNQYEPPFIGDARSLGFLWLDSAQREASEPRDYVYSLLGLIDKDAASQIPVDYTASVASVYQNAMRVFCQADMSVFIWTTVTSTFQNFGADPHPGLPSWCIDISKKPKGENWKIPYTRFIPEPSQSILMAANEYRIEIVGSELSLPGIVLDSVYKVLPIVADNAYAVTVLDFHCSEIVDDCSFGEYLNPDACAWLLAAKDLFNPCRTQDAGQLELWLRHYCVIEAVAKAIEEIMIDFEKLCALCEVVVNTGARKGPHDAFPLEVPSRQLAASQPNTLKKLMALARAILSHNVGRHWFVAESGKIGYSSKQTKLGDCICFIPSAYEFRVLSANCDEYRTCALVHGLEQNAIEEALANNGGWQTFHLR